MFPRHSIQPLLPEALLMGLVAVTAQLIALPATAQRAALQEYGKTSELDPLAPLTASLYREPWRSNPQTASAYQALQGVGLCYQGVPSDWSVDQNVALMRQLAAAGVKRLRFIPDVSMYMSDSGQAGVVALNAFRTQLEAARQVGIRPCITFVHIPPVGQSGPGGETAEGEAAAAIGKPWDAAFWAYERKTWEALKVLLYTARAAGFTQVGSYDLEMGQGLWWQNPAIPRPYLDSGLDALKPGGQIYELDRHLALRMRAGWFKEGTRWWGETFHHFEDYGPESIPSAHYAGYTLSFDSDWAGKTDDGWLTNTAYDTPIGPNDTWPPRPSLHFEEGAPSMVLARPEGWMADRTRHDNLISFVRNTTEPISISSIGTSPGLIPDARAGGLNGWQIKEKGLTRQLAFWLNQGARFVLLQSDFDPVAKDAGEMGSSLVSGRIDPASFRWQDAQSLVVLHSFTQELAGGRPIDRVSPLDLRYSLSPDPVLIPESANAQALHASDLVALLPFQIDSHRFAVAAYVVTPNVTKPMGRVNITLKLGNRIRGDATILRPVTGEKGVAEITARDMTSTTFSFNITDDVTWLRFEVR